MVHAQSDFARITPNQAIKNFSLHRMKRPGPLIPKISSVAILSSSIQIALIQPSFSPLIFSTVSKNFRRNNTSKLFQRTSFQNGFSRNRFRVFLKLDNCFHQSVPSVTLYVQEKNKKKPRHSHRESNTDQSTKGKRRERNLGKQPSPRPPYSQYPSPMPPSAPVIITNKKKGHFKD